MEGNAASGFSILIITFTYSCTLFLERWYLAPIPSAQPEPSKVKKDDAEGLAALLDHLEEGVSWEDYNAWKGQRGRDGWTGRFGAVWRVKVKIHCFSSRSLAGKRCSKIRDVHHRIAIKTNRLHAWYLGKLCTSWHLATDATVGDAKNFRSWFLSWSELYVPIENKNRETPESIIFDTIDAWNPSRMDKTLWTGASLSHLGRTGGTTLGARSCGAPRTYGHPMRRWSSPNGPRCAGGGGRGVNGWNLKWKNGWNPRAESMILRFHPFTLRGCRLVRWWLLMNKECLLFGRHDSGARLPQRWQAWNCTFGLLASNHGTPTCGRPNVTLEPSFVNRRLPERRSDSDFHIRKRSWYWIDTAYIIFFKPTSWFVFCTFLPSLTGRTSFNATWSHLRCRQRGAADVAWRWWYLRLTYYGKSARVVATLAIAVKNHKTCSNPHYGR